VLYRPGTGAISILHNNNCNFTPVYAQGAPGNGIGGYDLLSKADRAFAFDYNGSGKLDHLTLYRPGTGTIWILSNYNGEFFPVYNRGDPGSGIGGYSLNSTADNVFAIDYHGSGKLDHLALYRPGTGSISILHNNDGNFTPIYVQGNGIGGYDLSSTADRAFAFDYDSNRKLDYIGLYRPGTGAISLLKSANLSNSLPSVCDFASSITPRYTDLFCQDKKSSDCHCSSCRSVCMPLDHLHLGCKPF
jgi:hypothetical protein